MTAPGGTGGSGDQQQQGDQQQTGQEPAPQQPDGGQQQTGQAPAQQQPSGDGPQRVEDLPGWAQKMVTDLRSENASARTTAKQQAADEARTAMAQEIGKALGLVKGDEAADPEQLTKQLSERDTELSQRTIELAAYRAASKHGADPDALLDSRGVTTALGKLDPNADDFASQVDTAIKAAVESNPKLKAAQAAPKSGSEFTGGSGEGAPKFTREQISGMSNDEYARNEKDILKAMSEGRVT